MPISADSGHSDQSFRPKPITRTGKALPQRLVSDLCREHCDVAVMKRLSPRAGELLDPLVGDPEQLRGVAH